MVSGSWILVAALTHISRDTVERPEAYRMYGYDVPWVPMYLLSVAALLRVGAKKIFAPPRASPPPPPEEAASVDGSAAGEKANGVVRAHDPSKVKAG